MILIKKKSFDFLIYLYTFRNSKNIKHEKNIISYITCFFFNFFISKFLWFSRPRRDGGRWSNWNTRGWSCTCTRTIYLNCATTNTSKLIDDVESALKSGGVDAAKEVCRNTPGPVASIFFQGLDRAGEGVENSEKEVVAYGGVKMWQI